MKAKFVVHKDVPVLSIEGLCIDEKGVAEKEGMHTYHAKQLYRLLVRHQTVIKQMLFDELYLQPEVLDVVQYGGKKFPVRAA